MNEKLKETECLQVIQKHQSIILLWLEEKSYEEIAATIGITVKNVSVKLVRIKFKLGEFIKKIQ